MKTFRVCFTVGFLLLAGGCANVPLGDPFSTLEARSEDKALVYIYRPSVRPSAAYGVSVSVDDIDKAVLPVGAYTRFYLNPGNHQFRFSWPAVSMQAPMEGALKFESGNIYFLRYSVSTSYTNVVTRYGQKKKWEFLAQPVPAETALEELKCCAFSRPVDEKP